MSIDRRELLWGRGVCMLYICMHVCVYVCTQTSWRVAAQGWTLPAISSSHQGSQVSTQRPWVSWQLAEMPGLAMYKTALASRLSKGMWPAWDLHLWSWVLGLVKEMNESGWAPHNLHNSLCQQILILPPARSPSIWLRRRSLSKMVISSRRKPRAHSVTIMWISQLGWSLKSIQRAWMTGKLRYWPG